MKYEYTFRELDLGNSIKSLLINLPEEINVVMDFLTSDVSCINTFFLESIDLVLSGSEKTRTVSGNACVLEIGKDRTTVSCEFANFGEGDSCEIETDELRELILIWQEALRKFVKKQNRWSSRFRRFLGRLKPN